MAHDQTVSTMESDMDRWIKDRDMLSKKIEKCNNKLAEATDVSYSYRAFSLNLLNFYAWEG